MSPHSILNRSSKAMLLFYIREHNYFPPNASKVSWAIYRSSVRSQSTGLLCEANAMKRQKSLNTQPNSKYNKVKPNHTVNKKWQNQKLNAFGRTPFESDIWNGNKSQGWADHLSFVNPRSISSEACNITYTKYVEWVDTKLIVGWIYTKLIYLLKPGLQMRWARHVKMDTWMEVEMKHEKNKHQKPSPTSP